MTGQSISESMSQEDKRRQKLLNIQKREAMKDELTNKFRDRYSSAGRQADEVSISSSAIGREVGRFCSTASMTEKNLSRLERRIAGQAQGKTPAECDEVSQYSASVHSRRTTPSCGSRSARGGRGPLEEMMARTKEDTAGSARGQTPRSSAKTMGEEAYAKDWQTGQMDWSTLDKYAGMLHEQDAVRKRATQLEVKERFRRDLDQQVQDAQQVRERKKLEDIALAKFQENELKLYDEQEKSKVVCAREKALRDKLELDAQLKFVRSIQQKESCEKKEEGAMLKSQLANELDRERQQAEVKKARAMEANSKLRLEHENTINERNVAATREKALDVKMMTDYAKKLDDEEQKRVQQLQERFEKAKLAGERGGAQEIESARKKQQMDEERLIEEQAAAKDLAVANYEQERDEKRRQLRLDTQKYLVQQMHEKEIKKELEGTEKRQQHELLEADARDWNAGEKEKVSSTRQRNVDHRAELEKQIKSRVPEKKCALSDCELLMNKELLNLVSQTVRQAGAGCT